MSENPFNEEIELVPDKVKSIIRTVSPYVIGWIMSVVVLAAARWGFGIPEWLEPTLQEALPWVFGTLYYILVRVFLEHKWPDVPWLVSTSKPMYPTPPLPPSATVVIDESEAVVEDPEDV